VFRGFVTSLQKQNASSIKKKQKIPPGKQIILFKKKSPRRFFSQPPAAAAPPPRKFHTAQTAPITKNAKGRLKIRQPSKIHIKNARRKFIFL